jgi:predicted RNA-binding protein with RPS1 domain
VAKETCIKDIYAGKPDAKDEIDTSGIDSFVKSYIMPPNFDIEKLVSGSYYYITGFKGTGKTALLYYLDQYVRDKDPQSCTSFIFFKSDFSDIKRKEIVAHTKRLISSIDFSNTVAIDAENFEYIWRWLLYQKIVRDNEEYNEGLFLKDSNWIDFSGAVEALSKFSKKKGLRIPEKLKFSLPISDPSSMTSVTPEFEMDLSKRGTFESDTYFKFAEQIEIADKNFSNLKRSDIPYYIFIDELEAFCGEKDIFLRDLRMIRDLIFTVKRLNSAFSKMNESTKIICSIRSEILNAINRFLPTNELNKVTSGFEIPLQWDYENTNSFNHPIMKILLRRISIAEEINGNNLSSKKLIEKWFPQKIAHNDPAHYLLNDTWMKPRDIVRLIQSAQNSLATDNTSFSQATIDMCQKKYSEASLVEIKEEMRALYNSQEIDEIFSALKGFRVVFKYSDLAARIAKAPFTNSVWSGRITNILNDLYRLGVIGNYAPVSKSYRWQHRGDHDLIIGEEWEMMIHQALQSALSVNSRHDWAANKDRRKKVISEKSSFSPEDVESRIAGQIINVRIVKVIRSLAFAELFIEGNKQDGSIYIGDIADQYIRDINDYLHVGDTVKVKVMHYDQKYKKWVLSMKDAAEVLVYDQRSTSREDNHTNLRKLRSSITNRRP